jgi:plastocyanin
VKRVTPESVRGDATLRGRVTFPGPAPQFAPLKNEPCHDGAPKTIPDERVVVGPGGGLMNVFVYVDGGPAVDGRTLAPAVLDQVNCRYVPHAVGVVVGQPLRVKSSDPVYHNTHYTPARNPSGNFGLLRAGHERDVQFVAPEVFPVKCDVHPWMLAYVGVFDNPFFDVTDESGGFDIAALPAGSYTVVARHALYGERRQQVTVPPGQAVEVSFEFKPPTP